MRLLTIMQKSYLYDFITIDDEIERNGVLLQEVTRMVLFWLSYFALLFVTKACFSPDVVIPKDL